VGLEVRLQHPAFTDSSYNAWFYINPSTNPPTTSWTHPNEAAGAGAGVGGDIPEGTGERGLGSTLLGATAGGIAGKMSGHTGAGIAAGGIGGAILGHIIKVSPRRT